MTVFDFFDKHYFLAFLALCFLYGAIKALIFTIGRLIRMTNILIRGWPPEHLDADGDFPQIIEDEHEKN